MLRPWLHRIAPFLFILLFGYIAAAQNNRVLFDSISATSYDNKIFRFVLNDSLLKEVSFTRSHPRKGKMNTSHVLEDVGKGMLTLISGFSLENTKNNVDLKMRIKIKSEESKSAWEIDLFCKGQIGKDIHRTSSEDGGHSLAIDHHANVNWDQGASGEIIKENSKIGEFILIKYPAIATDSSKGPIEFLNEFKKKGIDKDSIETQNKTGKVKNDFVIIGELYGVDFKVVTNMRKQKYWVFQDQTIKATLQMSSSGNNAFKKNYHILVHPEISTWESAYWMKISLLAVFLKRTISTGYYTW